MPYQLTHPELFTITGPRGQYRGGTQDWYQDVWQRRAGCGPTSLPLPCWPICLPPTPSLAPMAPVAGRSRRASGPIWRRSGPM